jgi:outer membrane immunogenic protein
MKFRFLAGIAITALMAGSAFAADMPLRAPPPPLAYDWSGYYIGGVIGGAWADHDISDPSCGVCGLFGVPGGVLGVPAVQTTSGSGFIGGIEGGSRYQFSKLVVGWEADITWGDMNRTSTTSFGLPGVILGPGVALNRSITADTKWTATAVSTIGIAHDRWLVYGKAGVAWAHTDFTDNWTITGVPGITSVFGGLGNENNNRAGWTVGTGIEWAIWNNWSVKAEYDYLDFGTRTVAINGNGLGIGISEGLENTTHINQFKAGLNWHIAPNFW